MNIFVTKEILEGEQINHLIKHEGNWYGLSHEQAYNQNEKPIEEIYYISEDQLYNRIPKLKGELDHPDKTSVAINYKTGEVNINKQHKHFGIWDHGARASRQANIKFNWLHYLSLQSEKLQSKAIRIIPLLLLSIFLHWFFYVPLGIYIAYNAISLITTPKAYLAGDLGPAVVIDPDNNKIAAITDMSLGLGEFPLIRVKIFPIPKKYRTKGQRLVVAGTFQNTHKYNHWNFYSPWPVVCATKNETTIKESYNRIPNLEWNKLEAEIKKFESIPLEGYYPIDIETSSWKGMDLNSIYWNNFGKEKANVNPELAESKAAAENAIKEFKSGPTLKGIWNELKQNIKSEMAKQKEEDRIKLENKNKK